MQVNSPLGSLLAAQTSKSSNAEAVMSGSFIDALNAAKKNYDQTATTPAISTDKKSADDVALEALIKYMKETPEQHLRDKIMKEMGVTDESLAAMTPEQRSAVEAAIAKQIKEYMLTHNQTPQQNADASKTMTLLPS